MSTAALLAYLRGQGEYCARHGSPLYGALCGYLADDVASGGPVRDLLSRWTGPDCSAETVADEVPGLRLLGGLHRLVLARKAPRLALYYPSVAGTADPVTARADLLATVAAHEPVLREGLDQVPQTNEPGRAAALLGALAHLAAATGGLGVRLYEAGASAGLNLRADRLPVGPGQLIDSPLPTGPPYALLERVGADLSPLDPTTTEDRLTLTSYVWADDKVRLERLRAAIAVAEQVPVRMLQLGAVELAESLRLSPGTATVLWHSVMWQYLSPVERSRVLAAVDRLGSAATADSPLAYIRLERGADPGPGRRWPHEVRMSLWPAEIAGSAAGLPGRRLGTAPAHGVPVAWTGAA